MKEPVKAQRENVGKHRARLVFGRRVAAEWNLTQTPPWMKRAANRKRNRAARVARRITRKTR